MCKPAIKFRLYNYLISIWAPISWPMTMHHIVNSLNAELNPICHLLALLGAHHFLHVSRIRVNTLKAELNPICYLLALLGAHHFLHVSRIRVNTLNAELNPICYLLALLGAHHFLHVSRIRVNQTLKFSHHIWTTSCTKLDTTNCSVQ